MTQAWAKKRHAPIPGTPFSHPSHISQNTLEKSFWNHKNTGYMFVFLLAEIILR